MWNTKAMTWATPTLAPARAGCRPAFCRNRTLIAIEPIVGGDTSVAKEPASCARIVRCRGSRSGTKPVSDHAEPGDGWFLNGVVQIETDITPKSLLDILREIERALGRDEDHRSGPRTIDLDILFYGQQTIDEPDLVVPHPRMHHRRFVLMPLSELDPLFIHPVRQRTISQLLAEAEKQPEVRLLFPQPSTRYGSRPACSQPPGP